MFRDFDVSLSLSNPHPTDLTGTQKLSLGIIAIGLMGLVAGTLNLLGGSGYSGILGIITILSFVIGGLIYIHTTWGKGPAGIKHDGIYFNRLTSRGGWGWMLGIALTAFYIVLYWGFDYSTNSGPLDGMVALVEPISQFLRGRPADHWFLYTFIYTLLIVVMGYRTIAKYRHNRYQIIRTISVAFFQVVFAFALPYLFEALSTNNAQYFISYFWPLDYDAIWPGNVDYLKQDGNLGKFVMFWGIVIAFIGVPLLTYFFGKRWYCSWVCGCGGLAETAGDPFRQLSSKTLFAWRVERVLIHSILLIITVITILLWLDATILKGMLGGVSGPMMKWYGFFIGSIFAGVIGTGFYPILGNRGWCRFGCPQAAILGILQKYFSRFRITANGDQCISCGNCSTYCEMGIDVRWYAQRGQNIVRASCVGCGVCAAVCPRGVLRLENGPDTRDRKGIQAIHISRDEVQVLS